MSGLIQYLRNIWFSFPVQLLVLHCRRHLFLLLSYVFLTLLVTKGFAGRYGVSYLFLDPEYLGRVSFISFFLVGLAYGGFTVLWNITAYILVSHKFPFLATFRKPFFRFCLNNFIVPLSFAAIYIYELVVFQTKAEFSSSMDVAYDVGGFCLGALTGFLVTFTRSLNTHKKEYAELDEEMTPKIRRHSIQPWRFGHNEEETAYQSIRVDFALMYPWRARRVRKVEHYRRSVLLAVFRQHQRNALILELIALEIIVLLGFLMDWPLFRLPAAVSIFLFFAILIGPVGAFFYWLRSWATPVFVGLFVLYNTLPLFNQMAHRNPLFGMSYTEKQMPYTPEAIADACSNERIARDSLQMIAVMNKWKIKAQGLQNTDKPKLIILNSSGGGMRSSLLSFYLMQKLDEATNNTFLDHVLFMAGASGGTLGLSYYRELYRLRKYNAPINLHEKQYADNISKDLLNGVCTALVVNDVLIPWQKFSRSGNTYIKDRGYLWEKQLNENTDNVLNKRLGDYASDEKNAVIPFAVFTPTIINDGRSFNVCNLPLSFLCRNRMPTETKALRPDGIDAVNFFGETETNNIHFTSIIRANCTFPYIMPTIFLPTSPAIQCMDAGMRDNYGMESTMRFLYFFRDWINEHTGGVLLVQTRDFPKHHFPQINDSPNWIARRFAPMSAIYSNWMEVQDYRNETLTASAAGWLKAPIHQFSFEYIPAEMANAASMSWHLTAFEKADVRSALETNVNMIQLKKLSKLMGY
ncbi:MAG: hypothetical protein ACK5CD_04735 [Bacteroidota bacterium]